MLLAEFAEPALEQSGIVTTENGEPSIHPSMCDPQTKIVPLFTEQDEAPLDLLAETGCLSGQKIPSCATLHDSRMRNLIGKSGNVVLFAFSVPDLAVLDAAGLSTTLAVGIEELGPVSLTEFCHCYGLARHPKAVDISSAVSKAYRCSTESMNRRMFERLGLETKGMCLPEFAPAEDLRLIFVAWSPWKLKTAVPEPLEQVLIHLRKIHIHLRLLMDHLYVWHPTESDVERVRTCAEIGHMKDIRTALLDSLQKSVEPVIPDPTAKVSPSDYASAWIAVQKSLNCRGDSKELDEAISIYRKMVQKELAVPLINKATITGNPFKKTLTAMSAEIVQILAQQSVDIQRAIRGQRHDRRHLVSQMSVEKRLQTYQAMVGRLVDVKKAIDS